MFTTPLVPVEKMPELDETPSIHQTRYRYVCPFLHKCKTTRRKEKRGGNKNNGPKPNKHTSIFHLSQFLSIKALHTPPPTTTTTNNQDVFFFNRQNCIIIASSDSKRNVGFVQENYYSDDEAITPFISSFESSPTTATSSSDDDTTRNVLITRWMFIRIVQHCVQYRRMHDIILN